MKLTVAFLYNVRHHYPDLKKPLTQLEADFDDPITIKWIIKHLKNCEYNVLPIEADENAYLKLKKYKKQIDIAFNYSEGIFGVDRYAQLPAMLEMLQIPYTGSTPLTEAVVLNKNKMKEILLCHGVATLPFQLFKSKEDKLNQLLSFPLIVKPSAQGSSAGITHKSVVYDEKHLKKQVGFILETFSQPVLVEPFLAGREFSIAMFGNPPRVLPITEPDHSLLPKNFLPFDSLEVKWFFEEESTTVNYLRCPAEIDKKMKVKLESIVLAAWEVLNIRDYCRIDLKCDKKNNPYILDINSPPGFIPPEVSTTSYFPLACRAAGIDYEAMLKKIIEVAAKRYNIKS